MSAPAPASFPNTQVIVGLSGGVDSAVSALLLKQQGYEVRGLFMKNWEDDDTEEYCSSRQDLIDAVAVADRIGIDIDAVNFSTEYKERVFSDFLAEYKAGRTPNPDVLCNAEIKFKAFLDHALTAGAAWMATGHYARIQAQEGRFFLLKGSDPNKDQSYFLYRLGQAQLARSLFPVGGFTKLKVRRMAQRAGLAVHDKKGSTGICFIGERPFRAFLSRYLPVQPGAIRTLASKTIGEHPGIIYYTLGQREGLGIGGVRDAAEAPWYVVAKDVVDNVLVVVQGHDHPLLFSPTLVTTQLSWVSGDPPAAAPFRCMAKTRYRQIDQTCTITAIDRDRARVEFDQPQRAITSGQSVVFYKGEICLGGGIIDAISLGPKNYGPQGFSD
jgi:tRNA-uridine 2-sulfurtransferase